MARIRSIHPGIYTDEAWASVSIAARWLAVALMTEADDAGVFEWKPLQMKMRTFPVDNVDVPALLAELSAARIIIAFECGERRYGAVRSFCKYQRPRKPKRVYPLPDDIKSFVRFEGSDLERFETGSVPKKSELDDVEACPVRTNAGMCAQREDGGWRREGEKEKEIAPARSSTPPVAEGERAGAFSNEDREEDGLPAGYYETCERVRQAFRDHNRPEPVTSRVAVWLERGATSATIVAVIREKLAAGAKPQGLSYFDKPIAEAKPAPAVDLASVVSAVLPTVYVHKELEEQRWQAFAQAFEAREGRKPAPDKKGGRHFPADLVPTELRH